MLVDLVEITMQIMAEDAPHEQRTIAMLCTCRKELIAIAREIDGGVGPIPPSIRLTHTSTGTR